VSVHGRYIGVKIWQKGGMVVGGGTQSSGTRAGEDERERERSRRARVRKTKCGLETRRGEERRGEER